MYSLSASPLFQQVPPPYPTLHTSICFNIPSRPRAEYRKKKQPHLTVITSTKAEPTVSLSSTNAISTSTSCLFPSSQDLSSVQNYIPFPSAEPLQCHPFAQDVCNENERPWRAGVQRRRASACLSSSYRTMNEKTPIHTRSHSTSSPVIFVLNLDTLITSALPTLSQPPVTKPKLPARKPYVPSPKAIKRARKNRKQNIDLHFIAAMHRSIALRLRNDSRPRSDIIEQEHLLVERLWRSLLGQGCTPIPLPDATPPVSGEERMSCDGAQPNLGDVPMEAAIPVHNGLPSPPPSPTSCSPLSSTQRTAESPFAPRFDLAQPASALPTFSSATASPLSPPPTPSPTSEGSMPEILTMPQLVASLILRYNERKAARPRSASKSGDVSRKVAKPSPLSMTYIGLADQLEE